MKNPELIFGFTLVVLSGAVMWTAVTFSGWLLLGYCLGVVQSLGAAAIISSGIGGRHG